MIKIWNHSVRKTPYTKIVHLYVRIFNAKFYSGPTSVVNSNPRSVTAFVNTCLGLMLAICLLSASTGVYAEDDVSKAVRSTVMSVLETLKDESLGEDQKKTRVASIVSERFDFKAMTSRVLATNWKRASTEQKRRLTALFQTMLTETYWQKFSAFSNEEIEFLAIQNRSTDHASFHTVIKSKTARIPVDYKLFRVGDTWKAYDVVIEQVSLVRNYRGKFQTIVRKSGIAGLIQHLEDINS